MFANWKMANSLLKKLDFQTSKKDLTQKFDKHLFQITVPLH